MSNEDNNSIEQNKSVKSTEEIKQQAVDKTIAPVPVAANQSQVVIPAEILKQVNQAPPEIKNLINQLISSPPIQGQLTISGRRSERILVPQTQQPQSISINPISLTPQHIDKLIDNGNKEDQRQYELASKEIEVNKELNLKNFEILKQDGKENRIFIGIITAIILTFIIIILYISGVNNYVAVKEIILGIIALVATWFAGNRDWRYKEQQKINSDNKE